MGSINYTQVIPNTHSFGSLQNIITIFEHEFEENYRNREYFLIGFKNTMERKMELAQLGEPVNNGPVFATISGIITYLEQPEFNSDEFLIIIRNTLSNNIDLKSKEKMDRQEVYNRIDIERQYQDLRWDSRRDVNDIPDNEKPVSEWLNYMEYHLSKAKEAIYHLNSEAALAEIRKVTALGVRAMEIHGCPDRIIPKELLNQK